MTSNPAWSLESELCRLAGKDSLSDALLQMGMADEADLPVDISIVSDWKRVGQENYGLVFDIVPASGPPKRFFLKAFVPFPGTVGVAEGLQDLIDRRFLLVASGVPAPRLYASGKGTLLEEYIPDDLGVFLEANSSDESMYPILVDLWTFAIALDELGFAPIANPFVGLRTDGSRAYVVDFGQDLGPAGRSPDRTASQEELLAWMNELGIADLLVDRARREGATRFRERHS